MNKLFLIALLAIFATPLVAKTKVYGELNASYDKIFEVGSKSRDGFVLNNSFIGVKGSTEIKKDVSFIYQLSWGVSTSGYDDSNKLSFNNSGFNNRNQVVGLASPSGALIVGRFDTPFKILGRKADLFWHSQLGQNRNVTNANTWDIRADKIIVFQSPIFKGFQASIAYSSDIADTSLVTKNASAISLNGFYNKGKFILGAAYEQHDFDSSSVYQSTKAKAFRLSTIYKDGPLKVVGFYQKEENDFSVTAEADAVVLGAGIAYIKGKRTLKAQIYNREDSINKNTNLLAIGLDYNVSRQLSFYTQIAKTTNANNLGGHAIGDVNTTTDTHGTSFGVKYEF